MRAREERSSDKEPPTLDLLEQLTPRETVTNMRTISQPKQDMLTYREQAMAACIGLVSQERDHREPAGPPRAAPR